MSYTRAAYIAVIALAALIYLWGAWGGPLDESRYCYADKVKRDSDGSISRRADVLRAFRSIHPCPSTGRRSGACPGWNIDHVIPLANFGCDAVSNLQWLPVETKRCGKWYCKDRWERTVYDRPLPGPRLSTDLRQMPP